MRDDKFGGAPQKFGEKIKKTPLWCPGANPNIFFDSKILREYENLPVMYLG